jgi:predicted DNA-binding transcriptional regulator AlpA
MLPTFIRFADLKAAGIVNSWTTLQDRIRCYGFPPGRLIGPNVRAWTPEEIRNYIASCPTAPRATPPRRKKSKLARKSKAA